MNYIDDPDYKQIHREFLDFIKKYHQQKNFTLDWKSLCEELLVKVEPGYSNQQVSVKNVTVINYIEDDPINRQTYTGFHEISHTLFEREGFRGLLLDKYSDEFARDMEETICYESASIFLLPDHLLSQTTSQYGYDPKAVFALSERPASLAASLMRLIKSHDVEAWGLILQRDRQIQFSCTNTRFSLGNNRNHFIEEGHKIHQAWHGHLEITASIPYQSRDRSVKRLMRACSNSNKIVALFARKYPVFSDNTQGTLLFIS